jgi:hypothetical protein
VNSSQLRPLQIVGVDWTTALCSPTDYLSYVAPLRNQAFPGYAKVQKLTASLYRVSAFSKEDPRPATQASARHAGVSCVATASGPKCSPYTSPYSTPAPEPHCSPHCSPTSHKPYTPLPPIRIATSLPFLIAAGGGAEPR